MSFLRFRSLGFLSLLTTLVALTGCFTPTDSQTRQNSTRTLTLLANSSWTLAKEVSADAKSTPIVAPAPTLHLGDLGAVNGNAGINRYFGTATLVASDKITWGEGFGSTRMAGDPAAMERETRFLTDLQATRRVSLIDDRLVFSGDGKLRLEFVRDSR